MEAWSVMTWLSIIVIMIAAYLLGSIPSAVWIGKKYYGIDIREHGSKNAGTTNMLRVLGKRAALPVFIIDYFKGFCAVILTSLMRYDEAITESWIINLRIIATVFVVLGHIFPIFAGFKGGKGVATLLGAGTGIYAPIYDVHTRHYASLQMGDVAVIHTTFIPKRGARLDYKYHIYREHDGVLCCEGETTQLFVDSNGNLLLELPDFVISWKNKWLRCK
jgi:acyl-CoA thioesterase FadM